MPALQLVWGAAYRRSEARSVKDQSPKGQDFMERSGIKAWLARAWPGASAQGGALSHTQKHQYIFHRANRLRMIKYTQESSIKQTERSDMGQAKKRMMEMEEDEFRQAHWDCPECEDHNNSEVDIPPISFSSDEASDMHVSETIELYCEYCDATFKGTISNWVGGVEFDFKDKTGKPIDIEHVSRHEYYGHEPDYEDQFWEPSDSPRDSYGVSIEGLTELARLSSPSPHDPQFLNRVIFSHIITSLEAFLADTLILEVKSSPEIQLKLVSRDKQLIKDKFSAKDILTDPEHITKHINKHLRSLLYHNFPKIDVLFQICLGVSIFEDDEHMKFLCRAAHDRHDCVHRNGKNNEGIVRDDFTDEYVDKLLVAADKMVGIINTAILKRDFADIDVKF